MLIVMPMGNNYCVPQKMVKLFGALNFRIKTSHFPIKHLNSFFVPTLLKRTFQPKIQDFFLLVSFLFFFVFSLSAFYQSRLFWCELPSVGDICCRNVCFLSNIMELDGTRLVVLKVPKNTLERLNINLSLSKNHDPVTQDNPQTFVCELFHVGTIFFLPNYTHQKYHSAEGSMHLLLPYLALPS